MHSAVRSPDTPLLLSAPTAEPRSVPLDVIVPGDLLLVQVGQLAPCDGHVVHSRVLVSLSHLTGEAVPVTKEIGDVIQAGTRPHDTPLIIRVSNTGAESFLSRIARLVTAAQQNRPTVARFFDRFGTVYTRVVLAVYLAIALLLPIFLISLRDRVRSVVVCGPVWLLHARAWCTCRRISVCATYRRANCVYGCA